VFIMLQVTSIKMPLNTATQAFSRVHVCVLSRNVGQKISSFTYLCGSREQINSDGKLLLTL
jgi:hypothetical protein